MSEYTKGLIIVLLIGVICLQFYQIEQDTEQDLAIQSCKKDFEQGKYIIDAFEQRQYNRYFTDGNAYEKNRVDKYTLIFQKRWEKRNRKL